jgi:hypothetical protein
MKTMQSIAAVMVMALFLGTRCALAAARTIGVFVALADNENQGIVPVPAAIGDGEDPERNLYWGTAEGLKGVFDKSPRWRLTERNDQPQGNGVLRSRTYRHGRTGAVLSARAYRGVAIRRCLLDFEAAVQTRAFDLAVYIGHNGLMDFSLPLPTGAAGSAGSADCIVLCCKSESYFRTRLGSLGGRPVLLTTQFMYPGSFILEAAAEAWLDGAALADVRERAGAAYAANQKIATEAGLGVFAKLDEAAAPSKLGTESRAPGGAGRGATGDSTPASQGVAP